MNAQGFRDHVLHATHSYVFAVLHKFHNVPDYTSMARTTQIPMMLKTYWLVMNESCVYYTRLNCSIAYCTQVVKRQQQDDFLHVCRANTLGAYHYIILSYLSCSY
jgi:hypothetical protein